MPEQPKGRKQDEPSIRLLLKKFRDIVDGGSSLLSPLLPNNSRENVDRRKPHSLENVRGWLDRMFGHTAGDAEQRSKSATLTCRRAWGVNLRRRFRFSSEKKAGLIVAVIFGGSFFIAAIYGILASALSPAASEIAVWLMMTVGSIMMLGITFLMPDDKMFLDRLAVILPPRNFLITPGKLLWSNIEEVALVDLGNPGAKTADCKASSKLALRLVESSGDQHDVILDALDKEELPTLVSYIKTYASHARGLAQLEDIERFHAYQNKRLEGVSYTQLWESCAALQFGLTSFTPLVPGAVLQERFKVERQIAAGGFSAVYLIVDEDGKKYVLKESVVPSNLDESMRLKAQEQFEREAKLLARINHEQIARVYDHFVENSRSYLRIEYIEGTNLRKHINESKTQSERTVQRWCEQLAGILSYLHELAPPIVHRDLSPDNIVVRPDGTLVLIDFGAANEFIGAATGTLVGKHAYMAPEQIRGNAEPVSDIYSLGSCAFYCLTARDPEPIRTASPRTIAPAVTEWFDGFVKKCTALEREERFSDAKSCLEFLQSAHVTASSDKT